MLNERGVQSVSWSDVSIANKEKNRTGVVSFQNCYKKGIQCIHINLSNSLSVVMVNMFASGEVEREVDSRFPVGSNLALIQ